MSIDVTKPDGSELGPDLAYYIREARIQINTILATLGGVPITAISTVNLGAGVDSFDLGAVTTTIVSLGATVAENLVMINNGTDGQIVMIHASNSNVTVKHNASKIVLNGSADYNLLAGDWLTLINFGGDGSTVDGIWIEQSRTPLT